MLLVDDDEPKIAYRREDGAARADDDAGRARADAMPFVVAFAVGKRRMQHRDARAKTAREAAHRLRRERDLRHQHDGAASLRELVRNGLEIDFRLARSDVLSGSRSGIFTGG